MFKWATDWFFNTLVRAIPSEKLFAELYRRYPAVLLDSQTGCTVGIDDPITDESLRKAQKAMEVLVKNRPQWSDLMEYRHVDFGPLLEPRIQPLFATSDKLDYKPFGSKIEVADELPITNELLEKAKADAQDCPTPTDIVQNETPAATSQDVGRWQAAKGLEIPSRAYLYPRGRRLGNSDDGVPGEADSSRSEHTGSDCSGRQYATTSVDVPRERTQERDVTIAQDIPTADPKACSRSKTDAAAQPDSSSVSGN